MSLKTLAAFIALTLFACNGSSDVETEKTKEDPNLPPPQVSLPSPPPASAYQIPEKNPDGTLRVEGLIYNRDKYLDQQVSVKGVIVRMSKECDPKKAKKAGEECPEPNLFIRDNPEAESAMRVVGYKDDFIKKAKMEEGQERVFKGTYQKVAQGFVATEDGLILLDYVDEIPVLEED
jgi:hypothetical protein